MYSCIVDMLHIFGKFSLLEILLALLYEKSTFGNVYMDMGTLYGIFGGNCNILIRLLFESILN